MHRQSLGSPAPKLQSHGITGAGNGVMRDDIKSFTSQNLQSHRKDIFAASSSSGAAAAVDGDEHKSPTPHQQNPKSSPSSSRLIHLIPLLTFFCFLILYLSSHDPSRTDLTQSRRATTVSSKKVAIDSAQFSRLTTHSSKKVAIDSDEIDDLVGRIPEIEKNNVMALQSLRNLQQEVNQRRRLNRKFRH